MNLNSNGMNESSERPDEIELFEFESGPSDFYWKQRESPLDVENEALQVWDIKGQNVKNLTDFRFDGLGWSNDKDLSVMFDGIIDLGVEWVNGMGKQSRNTNWDPLWRHYDNSFSSFIMTNNYFI